MQATALAAQLRPLSLVEALALLPLIAENEPAKFELAAVRWHGARWLLERPEAVCELAVEPDATSGLTRLRDALRLDTGRDCPDPMPPGEDPA
jgi:hypothetical protein